MSRVQQEALLRSRLKPLSNVSDTVRFSSHESMYSDSFYVPRCWHYAYVGGDSWCDQSHTDHRQAPLSHTNALHAFGPLSTFPELPHNSLAVLP